MAVLLPALPSIAEEDRLPGYYPTSEEVELLGGQSREMYGRHLGGINVGAPDAGSLTASGLWHQDSDPTDSFYERHPGFFNPLDSALGFLVPGEVLMMESDTPRRARLYGYADPGFPFTRDFNPDLATMKFGPFYLDLLGMSGTLLYSDYNGSGSAGKDDGWLSSITLDFRGAARITENLYLTMSGSLYYLPLDGEVGFYFGNSRPSFFRIAYESQIGDWDYVLFDELSAHHPLSDIFDAVEHDEITRAGRYRFGRFDDGRSSDYFDSDAMYFINRVGAAFNGPLGEDFDASISFEHYDFWDTLGFDHVRNWDHLKTRLEYNGMDWWVTPYFEYSLTAVDSWDILHHSMWLGARARLTENLRVDGKLGYYMSTGGSRDTDRPVAEIGVVHELARNTTHSLYAGVTHHIWEDAEDLLASYVRYSVAHRFGSRIRGTAYVQYSNLDSQDGPSSDREGWMTGANLTANLSDYTQVDLGIHYDTWDYTTTPAADRERLVFRAALNQRLLPYLSARLLYQYEDYDSAGSQKFDEHLYMMTLRHLF